MKSVVMNNRKFAEKDETFIKLCERVGIPATKRQASKYRRGLGIAYKSIIRDYKSLMKE